MAAASAPAPAASEPAGKPLQCAMKLAKGAVELDAGDRPREAYVEYLKSIHYISQVLLEEATAAEADGSDVTPDTPKMLKVAEQCLERAKSSVAKLGKAKTKLVAERILGPAPASRHRRVFSDEGGKLLPFLPPEMFQKLQITEVQSTKKELSPLEEASLQNQKLKAAYEARLARLNPNQAMQKTSLTLSLQRQMMENLVIAKAREETLQRKMEERRLRLQEAANRRFSSNAVLTPEEQEQRAIYAAILEYEQDHEWPRLWKSQLKRNPSDLSRVPELISHLLSFADHPICQLLKKLQCSVYGHLYPLISRSAADVRVSGKVSRGLSLSSSLEAEVLLSPAPDGRRRLRPSQSLHAMFSVQENNQLNLRRSLSSTPFIEDQSVDGRPAGQEKDEQVPRSPAERESSFEDLEQFLSASETWPSRPAREAPARRKASQQEHLKAVVKDIHNAIDRLLSLTLLAFEGLNTAAAKDQCVARLEEAFFAPLWAPLLAVYRNVYKAREAALAKCMGLHRNMPAPEIGISSKLLPQGSLPRGSGSYPYCAAVQELMLIPLGTCPQKKLECIVRTLRIICECAEEYCGGSEGRPQTATSAIGADDLLPILSYVVLKSNLPQLVSECAALEEFIHEGYLIGEEGYCLTSLQSALSYVESLHRPVLEKELKPPSSSWSDCPED